MYYVYVLRSERDGKKYVGSTSDLSKRLTKHNAGSVKSTKNRRPFALIYSESFETKQDAGKRERFFKTKIGSFKLKEILLRGRAAR